MCTFLLKGGKWQEGTENCIKIKICLFFHKAEMKYKWEYLIETACLQFSVLPLLALLYTQLIQPIEWKKIILIKTVAGFFKKNYKLLTLLTAQDIN